MTMCSCSKNMKIKQLRVNVENVRCVDLQWFSREWI